MVKPGLLEHLIEVEDLIAHCLVLDDFVTQKGSGKILWCKTHNQLIMREFLNKQVNGFFLTAVVLKAIPNETIFRSSHVIPMLACDTSSHVIPTLASNSSHVIPALACGELGIYGCVKFMFTLQRKSQYHLLIRPRAVQFWYGGTVQRKLNLRRQLHQRSQES